METYAQRSIRHCLDMIAPFEASDKLQEKGQMQFYDFMVSIYRKMYDHPEEYMVFSGQYEEYIEKAKEKWKQSTAEKKHKNDSRECTLRNTFQQAIQFYALYFYNLGTECIGTDEQSGALIISKESYGRALDKINRIHDSKNNAKRYEALNALGVQVYETNDLIYITIQEPYSCAMSGLNYLCKAPESKYKWMNYLRLDYKNAYSPVPSTEDIKRTLPDRSAEIINELEGSLAGMRIKARIRPLRGIVSDFKWKVEYSYKGKNICGFYADNEYFMLCVYFNHFKNINEFASCLYEEDRNLFQWFKDQIPERLCKCPNNRRVCLGEETRRICGLSNRTETVNPDDTDIKNAIFILKKFRGINN
jgi:hypothetical protein